MDNRLLKKYIVSLTILFLMGSITYSASDKAEGLLWTDIKLNYQLGKNYEMSFGQHLRYDIINNYLRWGVYDLEISRKFNKRFRFSSNYRLKVRSDARHHSFYLNFYYTTKKRTVRTYYRLRYNKKFRFGKNNNTLSRKRDEDHIRGRLLAKYNLTKNIKPVSGAELFYLVNNMRYVNGFDIFRFYIGIEYDISKKQKIDIYWVYEESFNIGKREKENIIKLQYSVNIN